MEACRACNSRNLFLFLPMGSHPLANAFLRSPKDPEQLFQLNAWVCLDCALIQVKDQVPRQYFRHYLYVPSVSRTMQDHFGGLAKLAGAKRKAKGPIVDIGCNDGLFLKSCKAIGLPVLGIDPATNLVEIARSGGVEVINDYFGKQAALRVQRAHGHPSIIVSTNTIGHVGDLSDFLGGIKALLDPEGLVIIEVPHSANLIYKNQYDTINHEHMSEFSIASMVKAFDLAGLRVFDIEQLQVHGGSVRFFGCHKGNTAYKTSSVLESWSITEKSLGLFQKKTYDDFAARVSDNRKILREILYSLKSDGKKVAAYSAPAKGTALLQYCDIGPELVSFVADLSPLKQGLYMPGTHIPVVSPEHLEKNLPDYLLILAWNFSEEIMKQLSMLPVRFIIPSPKPGIF